MKVLRPRFWAIVPMTVLVLSSWCKAEEAIVAVASNFHETAKQLVEHFDTHEGNITLTFGSTGQIFAQVNQGAPFHAFLSADQKRVNELVKKELAVAESQFTYATGRISFLVAADQEIDRSPKEIFEKLAFERIAIANPRFAPYGKAAIEALSRVGWNAEENSRLATAQNVNQAFAMVTSGNAETGIVALSTVLLKSVREQDYYVIPSQLHSPIRQDAVLLAKGRDNATAKRFLNFISSEKGKAVIRENGYNID